MARRFDRRRKAHDEIRPRQHVVEWNLRRTLRRRFGFGIAEDHVHAQRDGRLGQTPSDRAQTDDAERRSRQLPSHAHDGRLPGAIGRRRRTDPTREVDHHANAEFGDGIDEPRRRARDQHARFRRRLHVDIADIHGAADIGGEIGQASENFTGCRRLPVADDHVDPLGGGDQRDGIERRFAVVEDDITRGAQSRQRFVAVVIRAKRRRMGQQNAHRLSSASISRVERPNRAPATTARTGIRPASFRVSSNAA